ncbi:putative F-box/LRR-repeat protein At3g58880 [Silene latifolia]|uniref:putative F-box/LRR-repeat protein At3g58880 n=1 Tax=Silene latifolia TaxID=37657 RepID=UPI003D78703A
MKSSMKLGEDVKDQRSKRHLDKISNLPDELLALILSFLPTWNAVRTSILSRRWRYLFTLTDCLSFNDAPFIKYEGGGIKEIEPARKKRFKEFVYEVLRVHKMSPIRKFSLVCRAIYDKSHFNTWVKHAIQRGVQKVRYQVNNENGLCGLSDDLVMCKTLVNLKVRGNPNHAMKIPLSSWLPSLKILHLHRIRFVDYHSMERLLSSCEFLEELILKCCAFWARGHVTISLGQLKVLKITHCYVGNGLFEMEAPKLAYLTYYSICGVKIVPLWKYSRSLVKAKLHFNSEANDRSLYGDRSLKNNCDILRTAADKITELHLLSDSV